MVCPWTIRKIWKTAALVFLRSFFFWSIYNCKFKKNKNNEFLSQTQNFQRCFARVYKQAEVPYLDCHAAPLALRSAPRCMYSTLYILVPVPCSLSSMHRARVVCTCTKCLPTQRTFHDRSRSTSTPTNSYAVWSTRTLAKS